LVPPPSYPANSFIGQSSQTFQSIRQNEAKAFKINDFHAFQCISQFAQSFQAAFPLQIG